MSEFSKGYETRRRPDRTFFDPAFSSNYWIYGSIAISWGIGLLPLTEWPFFPNLLVMTLVFWGIYQPQKIYYWLAFLLGLLVDTDSAAVFGQNSLAFCLVVFCAEAMSQRLQWLQPVGQAINILPSKTLVISLCKPISRDRIKLEPEVAGLLDKDRIGRPEARTSSSSMPGLPCRTSS